MLTIDNLTLIKNNKTIFKNLGFSISTSSALIIKGKNGSGKTTLLKIIAGICKASSGKILWGNEDINNFVHNFMDDSNSIISGKNFEDESVEDKHNDNPKMKQ